MRRHYVVIAWLALLWAIGNILYVYLGVNGTRVFRVESAAFILAGVLVPLVFWRPSSNPRATDLTATKDRLLILVPVALWLVVLIPFLSLPFLSDDYVFLASYRNWSDVVRPGQFFRPGFGLVFLLLARAGGASPLPFHAFALCIHLTAALCVYILSERLLRRADAAIICFAVFLLNPLQFEAVLWVSGLQELLWVWCLLLALIVYTGTQRLSGGRLTATLLLVMCALLSKETAVSVVLLLPAADWAFFRMKRGGLLMVGYVSVAIVVAAYLIARTRVVPIEAGYVVTPGRYFLQKFVATPYAFFLQPWNVMAATIPPVIVCCASLAAVVTLFAGVVRGVGRSVLVGPAVILISTLPVYTYFYVAPDLRAARYLYFATAGWALLVSQLLLTVLVRRSAWVLTFLSLAAILFASLQVNARPWRTAGEVVATMAETIRAGKTPELPAEAWQARYGSGIEVKDGIPTVYRGVYLFVNGYPEFQRMLASPSEER